MLMKRMLSAITLISVSVVMAQTGDSRVDDIRHQDPDQFIEAYQSPVQMYFHSTSYSSIACTKPKDAAFANLMANGAPVLGDNKEGDWIEKQKSVKNCWQQQPNIRFMTTKAIPIYLGSYGAEWVVGMRKNESSPIVGYIPVTVIELIPLITP